MMEEIKSKPFSWDDNFSEYSITKCNRDTMRLVKCGVVIDPCYKRLIRWV